MEIAGRELAEDMQNQITKLTAEMEKTLEDHRKQMEQLERRTKEAEERAEKAQQQDATKVDDIRLEMDDESSATAIGASATASGDKSGEANNKTMYGDICVKEIRAPDEINLILLSSNRFETSANGMPESRILNQHLGIGCHMHRCSPTYARGRWSSDSSGPR